MKPEVTIYVCDDDSEVREALTIHLRAHGYPVGAFASGAELLAHLEGLDNARRGICLIDVDMHGNRHAGPQLHEELLARQWTRRLPVLFLSGRGTIDIAVAAITKGALNFIQKPYDPDQLLGEIKLAMKKESELHINHQMRMEFTALWEALTTQQRKVVLLVEKGLSNKVIGDRLGISERMVEEHRRAALRKLGVGTAAELATLLAEARELDIDLTVDRSSTDHSADSVVRQADGD